MQTHDQYGLSERDERAILGIFKNYPEVNDVLIFGSRAKGVFHNGSDIDLAINGTHVSCKTLQQIKKELMEFKRSVINLSLNYEMLPDSLTRIDCEELLDEVKYLRGFIDCMTAFKIGVNAHEVAAR